MTPSLIDYVVHAPEEPPTPTVEVDAVDVHVVEDGEVMLAEHLREEYTHCFCQDGRHRPEDRDDLVRQRRTYPAAGSHRLKAYIYAVITEDPS
jgi:hypothetical protein